MFCPVSGLGFLPVGLSLCSGQWMVTDAFSADLIFHLVVLQALFNIWSDVSGVRIAGLMAILFL
ncbi:MAG: hypothetical protein AAGC64_06505 [Bacteroidota bacterium]